MEFFGFMTRRIVGTVAFMGLLQSFYSPAMAFTLENMPLANAPVDNTPAADIYLARAGFVPPTDEGAPRSTRSGATRGQCAGIVPLLPESGAGLTAADRISLYLYVPEGSVDQALLSLKSLSGSEQYDAMVSLPENGGIVAVEFPETMAALEVDQQYSWSLVLMCNGELRPDSPVVTGLVRRVAPVLSAAQKETTTLLEQAEIYGEAGLWYDLVSTLALLRTENPNDDQLTEDWAAILQTVGLEDLTDEPLVSLPD
jgi:hypothetical protein